MTLLTYLLGAVLVLLAVWNVLMVWRTGAWIERAAALIVNGAVVFYVAITVVR